MTRTEDDIGIALRSDTEAAGNAHAAERPETAAKTGRNVLFAHAITETLFRTVRAAQDCRPGSYARGIKRMIGG
jgi:hypothetical protein